MARILIVEDEPDIALGLQQDLLLEGYEVEVVHDGDKAVDRAEQGPIDLVLLDVMLPHKDGFAVCRELRRSGKRMPIILLTARTHEAEKVLGLELGADDYVTKPFSPRELILRVGAVLRRAQSPAVAGSGRVLRGGPVTIDLNAMRVAVKDENIDLTPTEYRLLVTLIERRGRVQSRQQLLENAWDIHARIETRTVDMHVQRLRTKLGVAGGMIETVRGFGYRYRARDGDE